MNYREKIQQAKGKLNLLQSQLQKQESIVKEKTEYLANLEKAQAFIQNVAKKTQEQLKYHIEDIVQLALDSIKFITISIAETRIYCKRKN